MRRKHFTENHSITMTRTRHRHNAHRMIQKYTIPSIHPLPPLATTSLTHPNRDPIPHPHPSLPTRPSKNQTSQLPKARNARRTLVTIEFLYPRPGADESYVHTQQPGCACSRQDAIKSAYSVSQPLPSPFVSVRAHKKASSHPVCPGARYR